MKEIFIHKYFFRISAAIVAGFLSYLLILLLNNNLEQVEDYYFKSELYLCIGLAFVQLELLRWAFRKIDRSSRVFFSLGKISSKILIMIVVTISLVTIAIRLFFATVIGFSPTVGELVEFNIIFLALSFLYLVLYLSSQFLYTTGRESLNIETTRKEALEEDFRQFRQGINPTLLFESLEALLVAIDRDTEEADQLIDYLAVIYRYLLSAKSRQLVPFAEEREKVLELVKLINHLPFRKVTLALGDNIDAYVIPGSIMMVIQQIVRGTIVVLDQPLEVSIKEENDAIVVSYKRFEKLSKKELPEALIEIKKTFKVFSDKEITESQENGVSKVFIPKLILN